MHAVLSKTLLLVALSAAGMLFSGPRVTAAQDPEPRALRPAGVPTAEASEIDAMALLVRGMTQHRLGNTGRALEALRNALLISPKEPAIASVLADVYVDIDDLPSAEYYARRAVAEDSNVTYVNQLATILESQGRMDEADSLRREMRAGSNARVSVSSPYDSAVSDLTTRAAPETLGTAPAPLGKDLATVRRYLARDSAAQAVALARRLVDEQPREEEHWTLYATALLRSGDADGSAQTAREGTTLFPGSVDLHVTWARATHLMEGSPGGEQVLNRLLLLARQIGERNGAALLSYASLLTADDQRADSLANAAIAIDPENEIGHTVLASIAARQGRMKDAEQHTRHTKAPRTYEWEAAVKLGEVLKTLGYDGRAREVLKVAIASPFEAIRNSARSLIEQ